MTEQQGPYFIERGNHCLVVRSKLPFIGTLSMQIEAEQQAAIYALPPMGFQAGMRLVLHADGYKDVIINGRVSDG